MIDNGCANVGFNFTIVSIINITLKEKRTWIALCEKKNKINS